MRKTLFLFGAGASVGAGCPVVHTINEDLTSIIDGDDYLSLNCSWVKDLWTLIQQHARETVFSMGKFEPNFENLVFLVEHLEGYTDTFILQTSESLDIIQKLSVDLEFRDEVYAYSAFYAGLLQISDYSKSINPLDRVIKLKGSSAKYMWAGRALRKLISQKIPNTYDLAYLDAFSKLLKNPKLEIILATLNYDLVFDKFLKNHSIRFSDGFSNNLELNTWKGFSSDDDLKYLKLHGSIDWFQIKEDWFKEKPSSLSINEVYKYSYCSISNLLKSEFEEKWKKDAKYKYEFDIPHLIMGGNKDKKILEMPFVEIVMEWAKAVAQCENIVIVGFGAADSHILKQLEGLLISNPDLQKIIIINPNKQINNSIGEFLRSSVEDREGRNLFYLDCKWNLSEIELTHKISLEQMLLMTGNELTDLFKRELNA